MTGKGNVPIVRSFYVPLPLRYSKVPRYLRSHSLGVEYLGSTCSAWGMCALKQHPLLLTLLAEGAWGESSFPFLVLHALTASPVPLLAFGAGSCVSTMLRFRTVLVFFHDMLQNLAVLQECSSQLNSMVFIGPLAYVELRWRVKNRNTQETKCTRVCWVWLG